MRNLLLSEKKWEIMREKFVQTMREKKSNLCIGLTSEHCFCYKPNTQYIMLMGSSEIEKLNEYIHEKGFLSISDHRLLDIGSPREALIYSPFPAIPRKLKSAGKDLRVQIRTLMR